MRTLQMWADLHCPYAYLAAFRLRRALRETRSSARVEHRSLAIEHLDRKVTPKPILDAESPIIFLEEPDIPYRPWRGLDSAWPVTMWPAFEAVKCARRQGWKAAHELDWALRRAFFAESRCISMRHVILDVAQRVDGLDLARLERDWDSGVAKRQVISEAREGWEALGLEVSPTFETPEGARHANPAAPHVEIDEKQGHKVVAVTPATEDARAFYRELVAPIRRGSSGSGGRGRTAPSPGRSRTPR